MPEALQRWRDYIVTHDAKALWALLHPDVVFESPVVHTPQRGRDICFKFLTAAEGVLGGLNFAYVGEWLNDTGAVLEFTQQIDGIKLNGVDIIAWNAAGEITSFKVMVRPLKAVHLLHQKMAEVLTQG